MVLPLALAQFIASYAASNMNVAISTIADDIGTSVGRHPGDDHVLHADHGRPDDPGSKLTDIWGRKFCFNLGMIIYGAGALIASLAQGLPLMVIGYSILEGIGSALMIPPIYILITVRSPTSPPAASTSASSAARRARLGVRAADRWPDHQHARLARLVLAPVRGGRADPLPGPHDRRAGPHRAAAQVRSRRGGALGGRPGAGGLRDPAPQLATDRLWQVFLPVLAGLGVLVYFLRYLAGRERHGKEPLLATHLFRNRVSNLGLSTQLVQWLILQGSFFVISVYIQQVRHYDAIHTGLLLTPATGRRAAGLGARRADGRPPGAGHAGARRLRAHHGRHDPGPAAGPADSAIWTFIPGLFLMGFGVGVMLTASVNVVQSSSGDEDQADISGCPAPVPTSARRWAWRSPARSWSPRTASGSARRSRWRSGCSPGFSLLGLVAAAFIRENRRAAAGHAPPGSSATGEAAA
jgi:hypothetical protein